MRTTVWDVLRLAGALLAHPKRRHQRIGQLLFNSSAHNGRDLFYVENRELIESVKDQP